MIESFKLTGRLQIFLNNVLVQDISNLVVTAGKVWIATLMQSGTGTPMSHMAVGTGTTATAVTDTTLEIELARVALSVAGGTRTNNTVEFVGVYPAGTGTGTLTEAGLFNDVSAGTMLSHTVFSPVTKGASDQLTITWTVTVG